MNHRAVTLTRLISLRLLWYVGVGMIVLMSLFLHTQFAVDVLLSAIAIYIPLSMLSLPLVAWLSLSRRPRAVASGVPPVWPAHLAGVTGIALLATYQVVANLNLAECGFLLVMVAVDLMLARRETGWWLRLAQEGARPLAR